MRCVCAWCGAEITADREGDGQVSHGICLDCADGMLANEAVPLQHLIDKLEMPVLVVDSDVTVELVNQSAQEALGVSSEEARHRRGGEVFDCLHSHLPGGCGRTIHCTGCVLRRAVARTHETGEPQMRVPATLKKGDPDAPSSIAFLVTTVKKENVVLVKLDKVDASQTGLDEIETGGEHAAR